MLTTSQAKRFLERELSSVEAIVRRTARQHKLPGEAQEDFRSYVMTKLIDRDYRRIREFKGTGAMHKYLRVVVGRLALDFRIQEWGKFRTSSKAKRLGPIAVALETLIYRDGFSFSEAQSKLRCEGFDTDNLSSMFQELPCRVRPRVISDDDVERFGQMPDDPLEQIEELRLAKHLMSTIRARCRELPQEDRTILSLRFEQGMSVRRIADLLRKKQRNLYSRIEELLAILRQDLEAEGIEGGNALQAANAHRSTLELTL